MPNVNPKGGLPQKTSAGVGSNICDGTQSHTASTSRWKCTVAFGCPVVPDVNASRHGSSRRGLDVLERQRVASGKAVELARILHSEADDPAERRRVSRPRLELGAQPGVADCDLNARLPRDHCQLARTQERHRGHRYATRLHNRVPARHEHRVVWGAQQNARSGHDTEVLHQCVRDLVRALQQLLVCPSTKARDEGGPAAMALGHGSVQQTAGAVHALGILQAGQIKA